MRHSAILFLFIATVALEAQTADISITALPSLSIPLGPTIDGDLKLFGLGGGGSFRADVVPGTFQWLYGRFAVSMDLFPLNNASTNLNVASFGGGLGLNLPLQPRVVMKAGIGGGLYLASSDLGSVRDPYIEASAGLSLWVRPTVGIEAGAGYRQLFTPTGTLYQGITIQLGLSYDLAGSRRGNELYIEPLMKPVFPLFYTWYDHHPAGEIALENRENVAYELIKVSFWAKQFMDAPRLCGELPELKARSSATIPVYALFNSSIFKVTEGTKAAGEFLVEYYFLGDKRTLTIPVTLVVENRNAMTWDDDRKAAAFITAKDPVILGFARNVAGTVRYEGTAPVSENFRTAFAIFQTLSLYGLGYAVDPQTPFAGRSADEEAIDFLQFPKQTLAYRGGDCDDLSVLYAALLESVGVPSALVTTNPSVSDANLKSAAWATVSGSEAIFGSPSVKNTTVSALTEGLRILRLTVKDAAGNTGFGDLNWTWDKTAPAVNAGADLIATGTVTLPGTAADLLSPATSAWIVVSGSGVTFGTPSSPATTVSTSIDGTRTLRLTATDSAGNSASDEMSYSFDASPVYAPSVTSAATLTLDGTPTWTWTSGGNGNTSYRYSWDNATWTETSVSSLTPASILSDGLHTLYVQEHDGSYSYYSASGSKGVRVTTVIPYDGARNVSRTPVLQWRSVLLATSYTVQILSGKIWTTVTTTMETGFTVPSALSPATTYTWRVGASAKTGPIYLPSTAGASFKTVGL